MEKNKIIWNVLLSFIVLTLFLGNFNHTTMAEELEEPNVFFEKISCLIAEKKLGNEKLEQSVESLLEDCKGTTTRINGLKELQIKDFAFVDDKVRLEIILSDEEKISNLKELDENIEIETSYKNLVQALVPIDLIRDLSEKDYVQYIRKPLVCQPHIISEGVGVIDADLVHAEGYYGEGAKVAVIDVGFEDYDINPEIPSERIVEAISYRAGHDIEYGGPHGSACTELVLDVAPLADLYLYSCGTISEFNSAVNRALSQNVDVISFSCGWVGINDYDGIGYSIIGDACGIVDNARSNGILFVVSSGNQAERHYEGTYTDNDGDNKHEFGSGDELLNLGDLPAGSLVHLVLSWNDWPASDQDYDLYLLNSDLDTVAYSINVQSGTQPPVEGILGIVLVSDNYYVGIKKWSATWNVHFELYSYANKFITYNHPESSLSCPADAVGATTVGATYWQDDSLEPFSSRGPTNDGRIKPDVTAPDGVSTYAYPDPFYGTSASAPHTAGAAALLKSVDPTLTANDLQNKLESTALDLGSGGKDNLYGSGRINVWDAYNTINQPPNAAFTYSPPNPTTQDVIQFTDTSTDDGTIVSWLWDFDDGDTSTDQNPTHQYGDDGTYTVTLEVTDDGGKTDSCEDDVTVFNNPPTAHIDSINPNPAIYGETVSFDGHGTDTDGTIVAWRWNSSIDGLLSTQPSFDTSTLSLGTHTIYFKVKDDDNEWSQDAAQILVINDPPIADFTYEPLDPTTQDIIYFNSTSYDPDGSIVNWTWSFGDGNVSYDENTIHQYEDDGTYTVMLLVTDNHGATDTFSDDVDVNNVPPEAMFTYSPLNPTTLDVIQFLDASTDVDGTIVSWLWDFDDGNASTEQNPTHQYGDDGIYSVSLTATDDDGATDVFVDDVYVSRIPPEANFTYTPLIPIPFETIQFTDTSTDPDGTVVSWLWDFGEGNTLSEQHPTYNYSDGGTYIVTLNITDNDGLFDEISKEIMVNTLPLAGFSYDPINPYTNELISFTDESIDPYGPIISWLWDFDDGNTSTEQNPTYQYGDNGTYTVTLEVTDEYGLSNDTSQQIVVSNVGPISNFTFYPLFPTDLQIVTFTDNSTDSDGYILSWLWDFGDGNTSTEQYPSHQYTDNGTYTVTLNVTDDDGATNETYVEITVTNVPPVVNFTYTPPIPTINDIVQFNDTSIDLDGTIVNWIWDFGDGNISTSRNTTHQYSDNLTYNVTLTVTDNDGDISSIIKEIITKVTYSILLEGNETTIDLQNETDIIVTINTTASTTINISKYSGNPTGEDISDNITSIGKYIDVEVENESVIVWPLDIKIYYTQDDLNNSGIEEDQLLGIYFWNDIDGEWQLYNDTGVNTTYNESAYEGYCWVNAWHLTSLSLGGDAEPPSKVTGLTVTDAKDGKLNLAWNEATDNVIVDHYKVYREGLFRKDVYSTSYQDTGLTNGQSYTYNVSAVDLVGNVGERSDSVSGTPTASDTGGGGGGDPPPGGGGGVPPSGGGGEPPILTINEPPIANANGPYYEIIDVPITFDGSESNDSYGEIASYDWDFGDGNTGTGISTTNIYTNPGNYTVTLTVTDDGGKTDTDTTYAIITGKPSIPPDEPEVSGTKSGHKCIDYNYSARTIDPDNDTIRYIFDWDDGTNNTISPFLASGETFDASHNWTSAGIYIINVSAEDDKNAISGNQSFLVLIDTYFVGEIGYFIDDDGNGIYDSFYSNETGNETLFELQENGEYKIDSNGDGEYDCTYNPVTGAITSLGEKETKEPIEILWIIIAVIVIALVIIVIAVIVFLYKKKSKKK